MKFKAKLLAVGLAVVTLTACLAVTACNKSKIADNTEHYDEITKTLKLSKSYEGKKLMTDGIGKAKMADETTDGDTTYFTLESGGGANVRYQGIDTPESTAGVERWGKAASKFTNERLKMATEIVIESASGGVPEKDSVGQRLLCYVWYKTEEDDFKLLNLELVENGYSKNKENATKGYYSYFQKAEKFARSIELRLFSKLPDPLYDMDPVDLSLKQLNEDPDSYNEDIKVTFYAYVSDKYTSSSGAVTFTIAQYDAASGKAYETTLYAGHTNSTANMIVGTLYHIAGTLQKHEGAWQVSGVYLDNDAKGNEEKTWRSQNLYYLVFDETHKLYSDKSIASVMGYVSVTAVAGTENGVLTFTGKAVEADKTEHTFTFTVPAIEGIEGKVTVGKRLAISAGYQVESGSNRVTIPSGSNITVK